MELGQVMEDYLETIYFLSLKENPVKSVRVAEYLKRSKPTVSVAMKELEKKGLVEKSSYSRITLTPEGEKLAKKVYERHCFFRKLLREAGIEETLAESEACDLEHVLSEDSYRKLVHYLEEQNKV